MNLRLFATSCVLSVSAVFLPFSFLRADNTSIPHPVQSIFSDRAMGLNGPIVTVMVWAGAGTNINFIPTGEIIKKVWLDDPSQIVLDFDGPMCIVGSNASSSGSDKDCENSAATVIHLRRIHQMKFPSLPRTKTTLLSVVTLSPNKERQLYQFRIAYGTGHPQYHTVAIHPQPKALSTPAIELGGLRKANLSHVEQGLRVAKDKNLLGYSTGNESLTLKVLNFLVLVRNGATLESAANRVGVSMALISKLAELGLEQQSLFRIPPQQQLLPAPNSLKY